MEANNKSAMFAFCNRAYALGKLSRNDAAVVSYEEVIDRFGKSDNSTLLEQLAKAMDAQPKPPPLRQRHSPRPIESYSHPASR